MEIADLHERQKALEITQSFIVQAPAGSGKTTLLTQRYLALLAHAKVPEEIVAITFTRKAANAMREKVLAELAKKNSQLQKNPQRLRIQTIDSLCGYLVKQLPVLAAINAPVNNIAQDQEAENCYRLAAQTVLQNIADPIYSEKLEPLLLHLNNDWQRAENLLTEMLQCREQWLPHIIKLKSIKELRKHMEAGLANLRKECLENCRNYFPQNLQKELEHLLTFAADNLNLHFSQHIDFKSNFLYIEFIAKTLLTAEYKWRRSITKNQGFPAHLKDMKERMKALLDMLESHEDFRQSLEELLQIPPETYSDQQWQIVCALLELLPLLAAELKLVFNKKQTVDHTEIAMAANAALGDTENPSDLALNLDYRIQHLLIDEFQDTSIAQFRLVEKLIAGWQNNDGRTLFVVGDPMQSIYRFREAEVGLFLRAQKEGIGAIKLHPLTLSTNFRSTKNLIDWVNSNFIKILPSTADIALGAVPFKKSTAANQDNKPAAQINLLENASEEQEAAAIIKTICECAGSIAILVRSRSHLKAIIPALQKAQLNYQAVELETLSQSAVVKDLFALTRALINPNDRIAWLAILRAPWCGLTLQDLVNLDTNDSSRYKKFLEAINPAIQNCGHKSWRDLITETWHALGGPATAKNEDELLHAKAYFDLLDVEKPDLIILEKELAALYAPINKTTKAAITIMTIHSAKGLEFDHVIIPGINHDSRHDQQKLLMWMERPRMHGDASDLLLAPIKESGGDKDPIYQYLRYIEQQKSYYETGRLLYVATTRAKKSLHLFGCLQTKKSGFLKQMENCFSEDWITKNTAAAVVTDNDTPKITTITRFTADFKQPTIAVPILPKSAAPKVELQNNDAAIIGTIIHQCLKQLSENADTNCQHLLIQLGCSKILNDPRGQWILKQHEDAQSELAVSAIINDKLENFIIDRTFVDNGVRWIIDYKTTETDQAEHHLQLQNYAKAMRLLEPTREIKLGLYFPKTGHWVEI